MNTEICRALSVAAKQELSCYGLMMDQMQWLKENIVPIIKTTPFLQSFIITPDIEHLYYKTKNNDFISTYELGDFEFQVYVDQNRFSFSMLGITQKSYVEFCEVFHDK